MQIKSASDFSYETAPKWHSFFFDLSGRFLASGGADL